MLGSEKTTFPPGLGGEHKLGRFRQDAEEISAPAFSLLSPPGQGEKIEEGSHLLCRMLLASANL